MTLGSCTSLIISRTPAGFHVRSQHCVMHTPAMARHPGQAKSWHSQEYKQLLEADSARNTVLRLREIGM